MIQVRNLHKTYDRHRTNANHVLRDVSFDLPDTGFVCILGPSGCGKTSLLNALGGLDQFDEGTLTTESVSVSRYGTAAYERERNRNFGYIFQNYYLLEEHSVAYNVYLGLHSLEMSHSQKIRRVRMALKAVEMERYIHRKVGELSGGQQQRIAIARALARRPRVIFADEPTGNLDEANTRNICTLLRQASRESLVIMVTHEERIARFFADRIITLNEGQIVSDDSGWNRGSLSAESDKVIYAGDHNRQEMESEGISLRLLCQEGASPVKLTVVAQKDRIVIRLDDPRPVTMSTEGDSVRIEEGNCPVMTLETLEHDSDECSPLFREPAPPEARAGKGLNARMMFQEARSLTRGKGSGGAGVRLFLVLLTVLALLVTGDYVSISRLDPEDFIVHDSHILQIEMKRGDNTDSTKSNSGAYDRYWSHMESILSEQGIQAQPIPLISTLIECRTELFYQLEDELLTIPACSQVPVSQLDEATILYGRMPEHSWEMVVDRCVLEAALAAEGVVQQSIRDITFFLGVQLQFGRRAYTPTIVGICDSGERSIYMTEETMASLCANSTPLITLSELRELRPGVYEDLELEGQACAVILNNAGQYYSTQVGRDYKVGSDQYFDIVAVFEEPLVSANIVVSDEMVEQIIAHSLNTTVSAYCTHQHEAMRILRELCRKKPLSDVSAELAELAMEYPDRPEYEVVYDYLTDHPEEATDELWMWYYVNSGLLEWVVHHPYEDTYASYQAAARLRLDGRMVVILTLMALSLVMLYLLCRSRVQGRMEMLGVYRLLGIPGGKIYGIFLIEGAFTALRTVLPAALLTWSGIRIMGKIPEIELSLILPWYAAILVCVGIFAYYLLVNVLPLVRLLKLPPAQLASKYDI